MDKFEVSYENEKYDIADFINRHPGGVDVLLPYRDKDITKAFKDIGHSNGATLILKKRLIKKGENNSLATSELTSDLSSNENVKISKEFVVKKLFTEEDRYHFHKSLGFICLLNYVYRYFYVFPTTGRLGFNNDYFSYLTLFVHTLLSCSSLIFHVLRHRIVQNPLIIYEEYRLHAINFTVRGIFGSIIGLNMERINPEWRTPILSLFALAIHLMADLITFYHGKKGVTAVRQENKGTGFVRLGQHMYALTQFIGVACLLKQDDSLKDLGFNTLIALQASAFLMTLKRKNLIDWPVHAFGYSLCLFLSASFVFWVKGSGFFAYVLLAYLLRIKLNLNKYLVWTLYSVSVNYLL